MQSTRRISIFRSSLVALVVGTASTAAAFEVEPFLRASAYSGYEQNVDAGSEGRVGVDLSSTGQKGDGIARSSATFGELHLFAMGTSPASQVGDRLDVTANAYFQDSFTINSDLLHGTSGSLAVKFTINGMVSASGAVDPTEPLYQAYAAATFGFTVNGSAVVTGQETITADGTKNDPATSFLGVEQVVNINFIYGQPVAILLSATVATTTFTRGNGIQLGGTATADLDHTVTWGGFESVRDSGGALVTDYSFESNSGTNYVMPIPEPGVVGLAVLGLIGCGVTAIRRRQVS